MPNVFFPTFWVDSSLGKRVLIFPGIRNYVGERRGRKNLLFSIFWENDAALILVFGAQSLKCPCHNWPFFRFLSSDIPFWACDEIINIILFWLAAYFLWGMVVRPREKRFSPGIIIQRQRFLGKIVQRRSWNIRGKSRFFFLAHAHWFPLTQKNIFFSSFNLNGF